MGRDKSLIAYHGKTQRQHLYEMVSDICSTVFLSLNAEQTKENETLAFITDLPMFQNRGPISSLMSAFHSNPDSGVLLVGCDYPLLTPAELSRFADSIENGNLTAFFNVDADMFIPLLAWYPPDSYKKLQVRFEEKRYSLRDFLVQEKATPYYPIDTQCLFSADSPKDMEEVMALLRNA